MDEGDKSFLAGILRVDKDKALKILSNVPLEKAFHFYTDVGVYTLQYALNLREFYKLLNNVDVRSLEFHLGRGDFESWVKHLGDNVLAMQIAKFRKKGLTGENLRSKLYSTVKKRCEKLTSLQQ